MMCGMTRTAGLNGIVHGRLYIPLMLRTSGSGTTVCSFRWFSVAESNVRWFVVREKHCWMTADSAE
jgi:hypothetical protein